jgi:hypothetical protein
MKTIVIAAIAACGSMLLISSGASALPISADAIASIMGEIDPLIVVKTKRHKHAAPAAASTGTTQACSPEQQRSNRTGLCIPKRGVNGE